MVQIMEKFHKSIKKIPKIDMKKYEKISKDLYEIFYINNKKNNKGLMIGKVQSGKTNAFLSFAFYAIDKGIDCVIILSGTKNILNAQTYERINLFIKKHDKIKITLSENPEDIKELKQKNWWAKNPFILVIKKTNFDLKKLQKTLDTFKNKDKKILIIDDEVDHASQDNNYNKDNKESTKINSLITKILKSFPKNQIKYLGVTATPQILFILEIYETLRPDFIEFIEPGEGYYGLNEFHYEYEKPNYVKIISLESANNIKMQKVDGVLKAIILNYFVNCIYLCKKTKPIFPKMMLNVDLKIIAHEKLEEMIKQIIESKFSSIEEIGKLIKNYKEFFPKMDNVEISKISKKIFKRFIIEYQNDAHPFRIKKINSKSPDKSLDNKFEILIGGENLSRGLTIPDLVTILYLRDPKKPNIDTTLQRARWFGYRKKILKNISIFTTLKIKNHFEGIRQHENSVWINKKKKIKDFEILLPTGLSYTRRKINGKNLAITSIHKLQKLVSEAIIKEFDLEYFKQEREEARNDLNKKFEYSNNHEYMFIKLNDLIEKFNIIIKEHEYYVIKHINMILQNYKNSEKENLKVRIMWMCKDENGECVFERQRAYEGDKIKQLFQGRGETDNKGYCGDRFLIKEMNNIEGLEHVIGDLQIHCIKDKNETNDKKYYHLAFIPLHEIPWNKAKINKQNTVNSSF